jgi:hypothetical protein
MVKLNFVTGNIGEILRLNQNWVMYSPSPPIKSGWFRVSGELADLPSIDLLAELTGGAGVFTNGPH